MKPYKTIPRYDWDEETSSRFWRDLSGSDYLWDRAFARHNSAELVRTIKKYLPPTPEVLDYGSGSFGFLAENLLNEGFRVATFEPSRGVDAPAYGFAGHPSYLGEEARESERQFDVIVCSEVFEHIPDPVLAIVAADIKRRLKPNGVFVVSTPYNEDLFAASVYHPEVGKLFHPWQHVRSWTDDTLEAFLLECGFHARAMMKIDFSSDRRVYERDANYARKIVEMRELMARSGGWKLACKLIPAARKIHDTILGFGEVTVPQYFPDHRRTDFKPSTLVCVAQTTEA